MKYTAEFRDINENLYSLEIITNGDSSTTKKVVLGDSPIVTQVESDDDIYKPIKYSSSTIKIITKDYIEDLYSKEALNSLVTLSSNNKVKWIGYVTPSIYNQPFECDVEEIELECIDGLSAMRYYDYEPIGASKSVVSFLQIINHILHKSGCYNNFYINDNVNTLINGKVQKEFLYDKAYISEQNFFDEDDKPMKCNEVIEEICRYCGLSAMAVGNDVFFVDYDCLGIDRETRPDYKNYFVKYTVGNTVDNKPIPFEFGNYVIQAKDYAENGTQISMDEVYNKFKVNANLFSFQELIPDMFDDITNLNGEGKIEEVDNEYGKKKYKCFYKYYDNPNYVFHYYDKNTLQEVPRPEKFNYTTLQNLVGATPIRYSGDEVEDFTKKPENLQFKDYILCHCHDTQTETFPNRIAFELKENLSKPSFLGAETYLIISGSAKFYDEPNAMFQMDKGGGKITDGYCYLFATLKLGNLYWDTDYNTWSVNPANKYFKLELDAANNNQAIGRDLQIKSNVTWDMYLEGEKGYAVRLPNYDLYEVTDAKPTLIIYQPRRIDLGKRCDAVWLSDFHIKAVVSHRNTDAENETDTEYTNVISDTTYKHEFEAEDFKICTWDDKSPNYSSPAYKSNNKYRYLYTFYHKGLNYTNRPEHIWIKKHYDQYSTPTLIIDINLFNNVIEPYKEYYLQHWSWDKVFIVDEMEIDWRYNKNSIKLVEKK